MTPLIWIVTALWGTALVQSATDPPVQLEVAVRSYHADGSPRAYALGTPNESAPSYVWVDMTACSVGSGIFRSSSPSAITWQYVGRIVEHRGSQYAIEISVRRMDKTASEASPRSLTLSLGEPVVLDEVSAQSRCGMGSAQLEVSVANPIEGRFGAGGRGRSASGVRGLTGAGGGGGTSAGGGAGSAGGNSFGGSGGGTGAGVTGVGATGGQARSGVMSAAALARTAAIGDTAVIDFSGNGVGGTANGGPVRTLLRPLPAASYDVEVWLVHTTADGPPATWQLSGHLDSLGQVMGFSPVAVQTTQGVATVSVAAMLRPMITADGLTVLRATIARVLSSGEGFGVSDKVIPMPSPADVVSFEMPSHARSSDPIVQFSLRVRITPGRTPDNRRR
jgi:hypothetical protein